MRIKIIIFTILIAFDLCFMGLHIIHMLTDHLDDVSYSITQDGGYAEIFQYGKIALIIALLLYQCSTGFAWMYLVWALIFSYFLIDDTLQVHERVGMALAYQYNFQALFGLRVYDLGELVVSCFFGSIFLALILLVHRYNRPELRSVNLYYLLIFAALAFFGVGLDLLHEMLSLRLLRGAVGLIEDGGEMLVMSAAVFLTMIHWRQSAPTSRPARREDGE